MIYQRQREEVVREAMEWIGTPYVGWGRLKFFGCDCLGFIAGVYQNCGLITKAEADAAIPKDYSLQVTQHQENTEYIDGLLKFMVEIPAAQAKAGDIVMFKLGHGYGHSAIVANWPVIIHSWAPRGVRGADASTHPSLAGKPVRFFTMK